MTPKSYTFDPLGRTLTTVADYTGAFNPDGTPAGATPTSSADQTTATAGERNGDADRIGRTDR